jgi:hypothetical protein
MKPPTTPPPPVVHNHGGQPAGGKHVPTNVPGAAGPMDNSAAVGSNIEPSPGSMPAAAPAVLDTPPWQAEAPTLASLLLG